MHARAATGLTVRLARPDDEAAVSRIDRAIDWGHISPGPVTNGSFFNDKTRPEDVLVAERDGVVVGWTKAEHPTPLPSNKHVWMITGFAVDPEAQGTGVGRALLDGLIEETRARGARRLTLRVFGPNERARRLYEGRGFEVEGVLRGEFLVDGDYVDDYLMALDLTR